MMITTIEKYYREEYGNLIKRVKSRAGSEQNAEDVVQEAFTRALQYKDSCKVNFERWFSVILSNTLKDYTTLEKAGGLSKTIEEVITEIEPICEKGSKEFLHISKYVDSYLVGKTKLYQEVIYLHVNYGYDINDISAVVETSRGNIRNYISDFYNDMRSINE